MKILLSSSQETLSWAKKLASELSPGSVIALFGDLGAGKTTLVRGLAEGLEGINPLEVSSPTFTLLNIYQGSIPLYHFDLYRLRSENAFFEAGFDEYLHSKGICCIEWAEKIQSHLPKGTICLSLCHTTEGKRELTMESV